MTLSVFEVKSLSTADLDLLTEPKHTHIYCELWVAVVHPVTTTTTTSSSSSSSSRGWHITKGRGGLVGAGEDSCHPAHLHQIPGFSKQAVWCFSQGSTSTSLNASPSHPQWSWRPFNLKKGPTDADPEPDPHSFSISLYLHGTKKKKKKEKKEWKLRTRELRFSSSLTSDRRDHTVAIFYQLFEKFAGPLQLHLVALERLSELGTVQIAVAELQRRMPHLLTDGLVKTTGGEKKKRKKKQNECLFPGEPRSPTLDYRTLLIAAQLLRRLSSVEGSRNHGVRGSLAEAAAHSWSALNSDEVRTAFTSLFYLLGRDWLNSNSIESCSSLLLFPCCIVVIRGERLESRRTRPIPKYVTLSPNPSFRPDIDLKN